MWQFHVLEPSIHVWLVSTMCIQASHTWKYNRKHIDVTHDTFLLITHWNSTSSLLASRLLTRPASYLERSVVVLMLGRQLVTMLLSQGSQSAFGDTDHTIETVCLPHSYVPCATIKIPCVYSVLHVLMTVLHMYVSNDTHANTQHQVFRQCTESEIDVTAFPRQWMKYMLTFYTYVNFLASWMHGRSYVRCHF